MYRDIYPTAVSDDLLTQAADRAAKLVRCDPSHDLEKAACRAVESLFCPCVCHGCGCADPDAVTDTVVHEVMVRAKGRARSH